MGVYVKNMKMPSDCESCPLMCTDKTGEITFCKITRKPVRWWMHDLYQSSEGECPLVSDDALTENFDKPYTNYDWIRSLPLEEVATLAADLVWMARNGGKLVRLTGDKDDWISWLRRKRFETDEEASDGED